VLIEENGNPMGTRIHAPIPNCIRPYLKMISHPKKADYTKLFAIATKFV
jgi:ribosomal protein L14